MGSYNRVDFYRKNRDYAGLLDEDGGAEDIEEEEAEEEYEEDDEGPEQYRRSESDEDPEVVRERQEYLQRRQKLKELERQKLKQKLNGIYGRNDDSDSEKEKKKLPYDNYGSFFGPSQPVVARRVIEETRARLQAAKVSSRVAKEFPESYAAASDSASEEKETPKVLISETKKKAQQLKAARDYSFLFTEDSEIPGKDKVLGSETKADKSLRPDNGQQKQAILKNSTSMKKPALSSKQVSSTKGGKGLVKSTTQMPTKIGTQKIAPSAKPRPSSDPRKQISKVGSGLSRPAINGNGSLQCSGNNGTRVAGAESDKRKIALINTSKASKDEVQHSAIARPTGTQKSFSSKASIPKFPPAQRKPMVLAKPAPKMANKFEAKPAVKLPPKPTLKPDLSPKPRLKPVKPLVSRNLHDERPKKRPRDDDVDEALDGGGNYRSLIRQMFGYNPNKYRNIDDEDDSDMEVGFNTIQAEERRSAKIAREEDEKELALIEAEEREERLRAAKKRKLQKR